jgi:hypothetical protein
VRRRTYCQLRQNRLLSGIRLQSLLVVHDVSIALVWVRNVRYPRVRRGRRRNVGVSAVRRKRSISILRIHRVAPRAGVWHGEKLLAACDSPKFFVGEDTLCGDTGLLPCCQRIGTADHGGEDGWEGKPYPHPAQIPAVHKSSGVVGHGRKRQGVVHVERWTDCGRRADGYGGALSPHRAP